jgi:putative ABC transport system permease protein
MRRFFQRVLSLFRRTDAERELEREVSSHLSLIEDEYRRRGVTPHEARLAARRAIGSIALTKDLHRDARSFGWIDDALADVNYTFRTLRRAPGFTAVAVLTLALGVGANTAIFSVVNTVLLRPLPYDQADRLVRIMATASATPSGVPPRTAVRLNAAELDQMQRARSFSYVGMAHWDVINLRGRDARLQAAIVSAGFFQVLAARPLLGRVFTADDEPASAEPVMLLSYNTWRRHFGGDPLIVGRTATVDSILGRPVRTEYSIIGVMPESFQFPDTQTQMWRPRQLPTVDGQVPAGPMLARLADGIPLESASAEVLPLIRELRAGQRDSASTTYELVREQDEIVNPVRPALLVLTVAVGFVLLLACFNVANLLLARTAARQREFVIRAALGAGRGRQIRYLLTESVTLALCGGLAGTVLAFGGVRVLRLLATSLARLDLTSQLSFPRIEEVGVDATALAFSLAISVATGVLFGLAPALRYAASDSAFALRDGDRSTGVGIRLGRHVSLRGALVAAEIGLAMVLLAGGGLLIRSFVKLSTVDAGYDPANVLTFQIAVPVDLYPPARTKAFAEELTRRLQATPGVESAAYANQLPMVGIVNAFPLRSSPFPAIPGQPPPPPSPDSPDIRLVSRDYLKVMRIPVLAGRAFVEADGPGRPRVMLINEALARRDFASRNPVGETVFIGRFPEPWQIVGVIGNVRQFSLDVDAKPQFFVDIRQWRNDPLVFPTGAYYVVRTSSGPESILPVVRDIVRQLDAQATLFYVAPMGQVVASTISRPRLYAVLLGIFAAVGLGLAVIGIYGVMAYSVAQRTREIGIRVALGARPAQVIALVVKQSAILTGVGIALGLSGAAMMSRYLEGLLFGVTPLDPVTFAAAAALFTLVALVAAYGPTRRATDVDPLVALRTE